MWKHPPTPTHPPPPPQHPYIDGILPKGPYPPCLRMADRALLAGYHRHVHTPISTSFKAKQRLKSSAVRVSNTCPNAFSVFSLSILHLFMKMHLSIKRNVINVGTIPQQKLHVLYSCGSDARNSKCLPKNRALCMLFQGLTFSINYYFLSP